MDTYLVDVLILEGARPAQHRGEVLVERVRDPEQAPATLELDVVDRRRRVAAAPAVEPDGEG